MSDEPEEIYDAPPQKEGVGNLKTLITRFDQKGHAYAPGAAAMAARSKAEYQQKNAAPPDLPSKRPFKPPMSPTGAQMFAIPKGDLLSRKQNLTIQPGKRASARREDSNPPQLPPAGRGVGSNDKPKPIVPKKPPKPDIKAKPVAMVSPSVEKPNANLLRRKSSGNEENKENHDVKQRKSGSRPASRSSRRISTPGTILVGNDGKKYRMRPVPTGAGTPPRKPPLPPGPITLPKVTNVQRISRVSDDQEIYDDAISTDKRKSSNRPVSMIPPTTEEEEDEFERQKKLPEADEPQEIYDDIADPGEMYDDTRNQDPDEQELYEEFDDIIDQETKKLNSTGKRNSKRASVQRRKSANTSDMPEEIYEDIS